MTSLARKQGLVDEGFARDGAGRNLTSAIVEQLGQAIVTGAYGAGNPFPIEGVLCRQLGVSRSVLREAVKMLTAKGLLRSRPRQGTWIEREENWNLLDADVLGWLLERQFSVALLSEFTQVRLAIEPAAAALAAERADAASIDEVVSALNRMKAAELGQDDPLTSDIAFHVAILKASGNRFYGRLRDIVDAALRTSIRLTNQRKGVRLASIAEHEAVADAIAARDPVRARAAMHSLLTEVVALIDTYDPRHVEAAQAALGPPPSPTGDG